MSDEKRHYLSYLLRLWQEPVALPRVPSGRWRASLEDPQTGELLGFGDVAQLFTFLEQQITGPAAGATADAPARWIADRSSSPEANDTQLVESTSSQSDPNASNVKDNRRQ